MKTLKTKKVGQLAVLVTKNDKVLRTIWVKDPRVTVCEEINSCTKAHGCVARPA
jgi:hypothetical protein